MNELDIQILSILLDNCREPDRQIGKKIGISGNAVSSRIQKMIQSKVIEKFTLKIEPPVLGYNVLYIVVSGQDLNKILKQVKLVGEPFFVVPCVGDITVCSIVIKENVEEKISLAKKIMKDVRVLSIFEAQNPGIRSDLTKTDLEIINVLLDNPRARIDEIAKATELSTKTITRSLDKLQNDEAILFTLIYDPMKLEQFVPYAILTWINGNLNKTLRILKEEFSESFLQKPFIAKNQIVLFLYSDNIFKIDDVIQKVRKISGIALADLFIPKKITLPQKWVVDTIKTARISKKLHLMYQTN
ncbi:MAG: Lrp/AsnC family transcriptional regulator [Thaumarchaeota archaeon]|nr:Lrp/AsnC family transcriptional regulator [Nitrososphaerota archaeon]